MMLIFRSQANMISCQVNPEIANNLNEAFIRLLEGIEPSLKPKVCLIFYFYFFSLWKLSILPIFPLAMIAIGYLYLL